MSEWVRKPAMWAVLRVRSPVRVRTPGVRPSPGPLPHPPSAEAHGLHPPGAILGAGPPASPAVTCTKASPFMAPPGPLRSFARTTVSRTPPSTSPGCRGRADAPLGVRLSVPGD